MSQKPSGKFLLTVSAAVIAVAVGYTILNAPDRRSAGQKIGDAIDELPGGMEKASRQLENRTPGEKLGDAVKDAGDDIKKSTNQQ
jgi:hypothetical protein